VHRLVEDVLQTVQRDVFRAPALQDLAHADVLETRQRVDEARVQVHVDHDAIEQPARARGVVVRRAGGNIFPH